MERGLVFVDRHCTHLLVSVQDRTEFFHREAHALRDGSQTNRMKIRERQTDMRRRGCVRPKEGWS
jgi:hypothetical protein